MTTLRCLLNGHDWLRVYVPGHVYLRCQECGTESPGLRGPVSNVQPPVIKARPLRPGKVVPLKKQRSA